MEYFLPLYPEQKSILEHWHQVKSIAYLDDQMVLLTLLEAGLQSVLRNEKCIFVIAEKSKRDKLVRLFEDFSAGKFLLVYSPDSSVSKEDVTRLQEILSVGKNMLISEQFAEISFDLHQKKSVLCEILEKYHLPQGDRTLISVLERLQEIRSFKNISMINVIQNDLMIEMEETQFDHFYDKIILASKQYHSGYYHVKQQRKYNISSKYSIDETTIDEFLFSLSSFREKLEQLRNNYYEYMDRSLEKVVYELAEKKTSCAQWLGKLAFFAGECRSAKNENEQGGIFHFFSNKNDSVERWVKKLKASASKADHLFSNMEGFRKPYRNLNEFEKKLLEQPDFVETLREDVEIWFEETRQSQISGIKYSNIFNQKDNYEIQILEKSFFDLVETFNAEGLLDTPFEINTLSLQKQTELLNNYILECEFIHADISENKGYHLWHSFLQQLSEPENKCIQWLRHFPSDEWPNIVESIFLMRWIQAKQPSPALNINELLHEITTETDKRANEWSKSVMNKKIHYREETKKSLNSIEKNVYQSILQNKGVEKLNWRYFFEKNASFFGKYFEIIVTSNDSFEDMEQGIFTNIFYVDKTDINPEALHLGKTIHSYFHKDVLDQTKTDLILFNSAGDQNEKSSGLASLDKLNKSKALAYNFYSLQQKFVLFQLKNANIISCLHPTLNNRLLSLSPLSGMKELTHGQLPLDRLVECLVEDTRKQILLIQDYLINPKDNTTLVIQQKTIESFKEAGFFVGVVDSKMLIRDYKSCLHTICSWIL